MKNFKFINKKIAYIIIGLPGSGKGTQGKFIANELNLNYLATGEIIRKFSRKKDLLGLSIKEKMLSGKPQSDNLILKAVKKELKEIKIKNGIVFDDFPLSLRQARELEKILISNKIFKKRAYYLKVDAKSIIKRLRKRIICPKCKKIYIENKNISNKCNLCKIKLIRRDDDQPNIVEKRIKEYIPRIEKILKYYEKENCLTILDGSLKIIEINKIIMDKIDD